MRANQLTRGQINRLMYWVSGIKMRGENIPPCEAASVVMIDEDAKMEYEQIKNQR